MKLSILYEERQLSGVYKILNIITGNFYIGGAKSFIKRYYGHNCSFKRQDHKNRHLLNAINKYGIENFNFEIVEVVNDKRSLNKREQYYLDTLKPYYNIAKDAKSPMRGRKQSRETIEKRLKTRGKIIVSQETKDKISKTLTGRKGRRLSKKIRKQISEKLMGHKVSEETIKKRLKNMKPWNHSDGAKKKISEASKKRYKFNKKQIKEIIKLRNEEDLSFQDIGDLIGCSKTNASRLYRQFLNNEINRN